MPKVNPAYKAHGRAASYPLAGRFHLATGVHRIAYGAYRCRPASPQDSSPHGGDFFPGDLTGHCRARSPVIVHTLRFSLGERARYP